MVAGAISTRSFVWLESDAGVQIYNLVSILETPNTVNVHIEQLQLYCTLFLHKIIINVNCSSIQKFSLVQAFII